MSDDVGGLAAFLGVSTVGESKLWLRNYARKLDVDYDVLMTAADYYHLTHGKPQYYGPGGANQGRFVSKEFWDHYQVVANCYLMDEEKWDFLLFPDPGITDIPYSGVLKK